MSVRNISAFLILFISLTASAQTKQIHNLKTKVDAANANDEKLAAIIAYCEDYSNLAQDSLEKYTYIALELCCHGPSFPFSGDDAGQNEIQEGKLKSIPISLLLTLGTDNDGPPIDSENSERLLLNKFSGNQFV